MVVVALVLVATLAWPAPSLAPGDAARVRVTDRTGTLLRTVRPDGLGEPVALADLAPTVVPALLAIEDRRFYGHPGVDPVGMGRALRDNARAGRVVSGGSTLTMQVARLLRHGDDLAGRGWLDKLQEMHLAVRLELWHSKDEILAAWLSRAPFGNQTHGIEAAARLYFGKTAHDLTLAEAALLVGLPQSPSRYNPFRSWDAAQARQRRVLDAMVDAGSLAPADRDAAAAVALSLRDREQVFHAPQFVTWLQASGQVQGFYASGDRRASTAPVVEVRTTLNAALQRQVEALVSGHIERLRTHEVSNAAVLVLDNATGHVLAYVGSAAFWDDARQGQNDGVQMRRQPGSALKPFTYAHALGTGRTTPATVLADIALQIPEEGGAFSPANYDRQEHGPVPLRQALACSYNIPAVRVAREIGTEALLRTYRACGLTSLDQTPQHYGTGLTLGNGEVTLFELARAYAGLARGGSLPAVQPVLWARTATGDTLRPAVEPPTPMPIRPQVAYLVTHILSDPEARAPAFGRGSALELPFPVAVKTGTTKDYRDNWTVGYSARHTVAVWVGNFDGTAMRWVSGVSGAAPILNAVFRELGPATTVAAGPTAFERPAGIEEAVICPVSGHRPGAHCPVRKTEVFLEGTVPTDTCTVHQRHAIDTRSGLLADADTPREAVEQRLYLVYPPEYHAWMRAHGLPLPPSVSRAEVPDGDGWTYSDRLAIDYPADGTVFQVDPVLRRDHQRVHLRGTWGRDLLDVAWYVDGQRIEGPAETAAWPLAPGRHTLEVRAVAPEGLRLRSRPVRVSVLE